MGTCGTIRPVELTTSYQAVVPADVLARYEFAETRQAAAILQATNAVAFGQIVEVLRGFHLRASDLITAGGAETDLAARLNRSFRDLGWREARVDTLIRLSLVKKALKSAGEMSDVVVDTETVNEGYLVDNFRDRVALDVEWNAKDGNLDRDISAYRALYEPDLIDVGVMVTRVHNELRDLGRRLARDAGQTEQEIKRVLGTTTTTNKEKLLPRIQRGDAGGCPFLAVFICPATYGDSP